MVTRSPFLDKSSNAERQSRNQSCHRAGCRLEVAGWLPTRSVNLQPPTCNLQLATSSQPANNFDYCSAEGTAALKSVRAIPNPRPEDRRPKETRRPRPELIATPAEQPPVESGSSRNSESGYAVDSPNTLLRHGLHGFSQIESVLIREIRVKTRVRGIKCMSRIRNSDFGLLSGFGLRSSDFRAAEHTLPSTGRTLEQPCAFEVRVGAWAGPPHAVVLAA